MARTEKGIRGWEWSGQGVVVKSRRFGDQCRWREWGEVGLGVELGDKIKGPGPWVS